jgi:hypothetical protein
MSPPYLDFAPNIVLPSPNQLEVALLYLLLPTSTLLFVLSPLANLKMPNKLPETFSLSDNNLFLTKLFVVHYLGLV